MKTTPSLVKLILFALITVLATGTLAATIANVQLGDKATYKAVFKGDHRLDKATFERSVVEKKRVPSASVKLDSSTAAVRMEASTTVPVSVPSLLHNPAWPSPRTAK